MRDRERSGGWAGTGRLEYNLNRAGLILGESRRRLRTIVCLVEIACYVDRVYLYIRWPLV